MAATKAQKAAYIKDSKAKKAGKNKTEAKGRKGKGKAYKGSSNPFDALM